MLAVVHAWVATGAAIVAGAVLVLALLDATGVVATRRWQDRLAVALVVLLIVVALLGPGIVIGLRPPSDPMHYLYAIAAISAVPAGRLLAVRKGSGRVSWWVAGGALVTLLALLRLWNTGG